MAAAVCHGPTVLVGLKLSDGRQLVDGRRVACFTNDEERAVGMIDVVPFLLTDALAAFGATLDQAPPFMPHTVVDGRLVTGQNPASAKAVAEEAVALLDAPGRGRPIERSRAGAEGWEDEERSLEGDCSALG